jgi:hypothetical protein
VAFYGDRAIDVYSFCVPLKAFWYLVYGDSCEGKCRSNARASCVM